MSETAEKTRAGGAPGAAARELRRESYAAIRLYAPDRAPARIDLSDNTNLWGVPPRAREALREALRAAQESAITRYPALYAQQLKDALAAYAGVRPDEVVTGCGSDDVLDSAVRAFAEPGERVATSAPSFAMIPLFARMNGLEPAVVPLDGAWQPDVDALLATGARVTYVCSPNNPTGTAVGRARVERLLREARGVVIVDEAYAEFADAPAGAHAGWLAEAPRHANLLVVRTMSKAFGLAGLRVGYAAGAAPLVAEVEKSRGPYKVSALAERAAVAALTEDRAWVDAHVALARAHRARLHDALAALGLRPLPSEANFVLVPVPDAEALAARLRRRGVAVRPFAALPGLGDALRISLGPWEMVEEAVAALAEELAAGGRGPDG